MVPQEWLKATMWRRTLTRSEGRLQLHSQSPGEDHLRRGACFIDVIGRPYELIKLTKVSKGMMITKMLQLGGRRPEFVETGEPQLRRRLHLPRALLWGEILEFANAAGAGKHYWGMGHCRLRGGPHRADESCQKVTSTAT
eukprot:8818367-Pyramimonas_sp.AAC.1